MQPPLGMEFEALGDWTRYLVGAATAFTDTNALITGTPTSWESLTIAAPGADKSAWGDGAWWTWPALQTDGTLYADDAEDMRRAAWALRVVSDPSVANSGIVLRFGLFNGINRAALSGPYIAFDFQAAGNEPVVGGGMIDTGADTAGWNGSPSGTARQIELSGATRAGGYWRRATIESRTAAGAKLITETAQFSWNTGVAGQQYFGLEIGRANVANASTLGLRVGSIIDPEPASVLL